MDSGTIISAVNLTIGYRAQNGGKQWKYEGISFELQARTLTCLLGRNGVGKSTLLRTIAAFQRPLSGDILLEGERLSSYTAHGVSRKIGVVLTDRIHAGGLRVHELVALGRQPHTGFFGNLRRRDRLAVEEAMEAVGIAHKRSAYVAELSDGERQRALIAKVLVQECPVILLDEPTAFLDAESRIEVMALLRRIAVEQKRAILLTTHDVEQALLQADRLWLLKPGKGLRYGVTEDLAVSGELDTLFDGDGIRFDRRRGGFVSVVRKDRTAVVVSEDETLRFWCAHLLGRYHWNVVHETGDGCPVIEAVSDHEIRWREGLREEIFRSFEELADRLLSESRFL